MNPSRTEVPPERWELEDEHRRKLAQTTQQILKGKTNNGFRVTLTPMATKTTIPVSFARAGGVAQLAPETSNAAASSAQVFACSINGAIEVHHDASPETDRTFGVVLTG